MRATNHVIFIISMIKIDVTTSLCSQRQALIMLQAPNSDPALFLQILEAPSFSLSSSIHPVLL